MAFGNRSAVTYDVGFNVALGKFRADMSESERVYERTTQALSSEAIRTALAQDRLNRAIAGSGPESAAAARATLAYRKEMEALAAEQTVAARTTAQTARAEITANVERRASLQALAAEYRVAAAAAVHGSEEQLVAARLATRAERELGIAAAHTSVSFASEERSLGRFTRGALAGSGIFRGLGRSLAFASTAFLGGTGLVYAIRASTQAAIEQQAIIANLKNALAVAGKSWEQYGTQIEESTRKTKLLAAFDDEELYKSLQILIRGNGDVTKSLKENAFAADIARARNKDLTQVAVALAKAEAGQETALRRLVPGLSKTAHGYALVEEAARKSAGAAAAYAGTAAGAQARFAIAIQDTEKAIGRALLPTVTAYLNKGAAWLEQDKNQARLARDVKTVVEDLSKALKLLAHGFDLVHDAAAPVIGALGGIENTLKLLVALKITTMLNGWVGGFRAAETAAAGTAGAMSTLAGAETAATAASAGLLRNLRALALLGTITVGVELLLNKGAVDKSVTSFLNEHGLGSLTGKQYGSLAELEAAAATNTPEGAIARKLLKKLQDQGLVPKGVRHKLGSRQDRPTSTEPTPTKVAAAGPKPSRNLTRQERVTLAIANAPEGSDALIKALREQENIDRGIISFGEKLLREHRGNTGQLVATIARLKDQDKSLDSQINAILEGRVKAKEKTAKERASIAKKQADAEAKAALELGKIISGFHPKIKFPKGGGISGAGGPVPGTPADIRANEQQFLASFLALQQFRNNFAPVDNGRTDMHLGTLVHETRRNTAVTAELVKQGRFPASRYSASTAQAVFG